jgi:L-fucose isomerase-like protein
MKVKIGVVPTYRNSYKEWARELHGRCRKALSAIESVDVVEIPDTEATPFGCVHTLDEAATAAEHLRREGVSGIVVLPLDFGDERSVAKVAEVLEVPVLLFATKEPPKGAHGRVSDAYCGTLVISSAMHRREIGFRFGGVVFPEDAEFAEEVETFARAAAVVDGLKGARVGQVGHRPATFESVGCDEAELARRLGVSVVPCDVGDIWLAAQSLEDDDEAVAGIVAEMKGEAPAHPADEKLLKLAKMERALRAFCEKEGVAALGGRCWPTFGRLVGSQSCALFGRLTEQGVPTACEADVLGALSMLATHRAALGATAVHFIDWTMQHREDPNRLLAWHCGNAPACLAREPEKVKMHDYGNFEFELKPGPVTFFRLMEYGGDWRALIARGAIVPGEESEGGTWSWVEVSDGPELYRTLIEEGFIHHASMVHGDYVDALEEACGFMEMRPIVVE